MPITPTYPGVYIQEIPSQVRTIVGVATSIAAFVDYFTRGPMNKAVQILNMGDFEREFGGLNKDSEACYAIQQFFLNGGTEAWVVRVASPDPPDPNAPAKSRVFISNVTVPLASLPANETAAATAAALTVFALSEGTWGDNLRVRVDLAPTTNEFNLLISEYGTVAGRLAPVRQETFANLSMNTTRSNFVEKVVNDPITGSKFVSVSANGANPPLANGTVSGAHTATPPLATSATIQVTIGSSTAPAILAFPSNLASLPIAQALTKIAAGVQAGIRAAAGQQANSAFTNATVEAIRVGTSNYYLRVMAGPGTTFNRIVIAPSGGDTTSDTLRFSGANVGTVNVQEYTLGTGNGIADTAQIFTVAGKNGVPPDSNALIGALASKTGIYALEDVDLFNLLCIPRTANVGTGTNDLNATQAQAVMSAAIGYCEQRRSFFVMDTPKGVDEITEVQGWLAANDTLRDRNAALYYPRVKIPNPLDEFRLRSVGASGTVAGLYARTDAARGVWKAPAGTDATLRNVSELEDILTDAENGTLNPLAINCLRNFPVYGHICWGARTLDGSDQQASEWKYIPVRRLALFLEESLYRGTKWVVFEPNDEPLWAQIRLNIGAFMQNLFRQGAFQGKTPQEAYFVKCDKETTTQDDINRGIVNILVGFAPLKPAEFVIIKIQQMAGQIQG